MGSMVPIVASADDLPEALRYAQLHPSSRWYVADRARVLGRADAIPADWGVPPVITAAAPAAEALGLTEGEAGALSDAYFSVAELTDEEMVNPLVASSITAEERQKCAEDGTALADGSFPIRNKSELHKAINLRGSGTASKGKVVRHIRKRAKALGLEDDPKLEALTAAFGRKGEEELRRAGHAFSEALHPRGRDGQFITKGGRVVVVGGNGSKVEGIVKDIDTDHLGKTQIHVQTDDGHKLVAQAHSVEQAPTARAHIAPVDTGTRATPRTTSANAATRKANESDTAFAHGNAAKAHSVAAQRSTGTLADQHTRAAGEHEARAAELRAQQEAHRQAAADSIAHGGQPRPTGPGSESAEAPKPGDRVVHTPSKHSGTVTQAHGDGTSTVEFDRRGGKTTGYAQVGNHELERTGETRPVRKLPITTSLAEERAAASRPAPDTHPDTPAVHPADKAPEPQRKATVGPVAVTNRSNNRYVVRGDAANGATEKANQTAAPEDHRIAGLAHDQAALNAPSARARAAHMEARDQHFKIAGLAGGSPQAGEHFPKAEDKTPIRLTGNQEINLSTGKVTEGAPTAEPESRFLVEPQRLQFSDDEANSHKFYESSVVGHEDGTASHVTRWGRNGTVGQSKADQHPSALAARDAHARTLEAKQKKGYYTAWSEKGSHEAHLSRAEQNRAHEASLARESGAEPPVARPPSAAPRDENAGAESIYRDAAKSSDGDLGGLGRKGETTPPAPDDGPTLRVRNEAQRILMEEHLKGQISDGMWENASHGRGPSGAPGEGWKHWTNAKVVVDPEHVGRNFSPNKDNYNLNHKSLLDAVGDEMVDSVKSGHDPNYSHGKMVKDLADLKKIFKTRRDSLKAEEPSAPEPTEADHLRSGLAKLDKPGTEWTDDEHDAIASDLGDKVWGKLNERYPEYGGQGDDGIQETMDNLIEHVMSNEPEAVRHPDTAEAIANRVEDRHSEDLGGEDYPDGGGDFNSRSAEQMDVAANGTPAQRLEATMNDWESEEPTMGDHGSEFLSIASQAHATGDKKTRDDALHAASEYADSEDDPELQDSVAELRNNYADADKAGGSASEGAHPDTSGLDPEPLPDGHESQASMAHHAADLSQEASNFHDSIGDNPTPEELSHLASLHEEAASAHGDAGNYDEQDWHNAQARQSHQASIDREMAEPIAAPRANTPAEDAKLATSKANVASRSAARFPATRTRAAELHDEAAAAHEAIGNADVAAQHRAAAAAHRGESAPAYSREGQADAAVKARYDAARSDARRASDRASASGKPEDHRAAVAAHAEAADAATAAGMADARATHLSEADAHVDSADRARRTTPGAPAAADTSHPLHKIADSVVNKGIGTREGVADRVSEILSNPDHAAAHKDLAKLMGEAKLGGKQRARYRELLNQHHGSSGAGRPADSLSPDNPVRQRLEAAQAKIREGHPDTGAHPADAAPTQNGLAITEGTGHDGAPRFVVRKGGAELSSFRTRAEAERRMRVEGGRPADSAATELERNTADVGNGFGSQPGAAEMAQHLDSNAWTHPEGSGRLVSKHPSGATVHRDGQGFIGTRDNGDYRSFATRGDAEKYAASQRGQYHQSSDNELYELARQKNAQGSADAKAEMQARGLPVVEPHQLDDIANQHLDVPTLRVRNSDSHDFHDVGNYGMRNAIQAAYERGGGRGRLTQAQHDKFAKDAGLGHDLQDHNSDGEDFHDTGVGDIRRMLEAAHGQGAREAAARNRPRPTGNLADPGGVNRADQEKLAAGMNDRELGAEINRHPAGTPAGDVARAEKARRAAAPERPPSALSDAELTRAIGTTRDPAKKRELEAERMNRVDFGKVSDHYGNGSKAGVFPGVKVSSDRGEVTVHGTHVGYVRATNERGRRGFQAYDSTGQAIPGGMSGSKAQAMSDLFGHLHGRESDAAAREARQATIPLGQDTGPIVAPGRSAYDNDRRLSVPPGEPGHGEATPFRPTPTAHPDVPAEPKWTVSHHEEEFAGIPSGGTQDIHMSEVNGHEIIVDEPHTGYGWRYSVRGPDGISERAHDGRTHYTQPGDRNSEGRAPTTFRTAEDAKRAAVEAARALPNDADRHLGELTPAQTKQVVDRFSPSGGPGRDRTRNAVRFYLEAASKQARAARGGVGFYTEHDRQRLKNAEAGLRQLGIDPARIRETAMRMIGGPATPGKA